MVRRLAVSLALLGVVAMTSSAFAYERGGPSIVTKNPKHPHQTACGHAATVVVCDNRVVMTNPE